MWKSVLLAGAVATCVAAGPVVNIELVSFTSSVSTRAGGMPCSDPSSCSSESGTGLTFEEASAGAAPLTLSVFAGVVMFGLASASASFDAVEMVTITGGAGSGIVEICAAGTSSYSGFAGGSVSLGSGPGSPLFIDYVPANEVCLAPGLLLSSAAGAFEFTYGVPFEFGLGASLTAGASTDAGEGGASVNVTGFDVVLLTPEPSTTVPLLLGCAYFVVRRLRAARRSS
jgi:hypothetical protein